MAAPGVSSLHCPRCVESTTRLYLISIIIDTVQVRCAAAVSLSARCLGCRARLVALPGSWPPAAHTALSSAY